MSTPPHSQAVLLRCRAVNAAQLSACFAEEAQRYERMAQAADPDSDWSLSDPRDPDSGDFGRVPDNWLELAELPLPEAP